MNSFSKITKFELLNSFKSKWLIAYFLFFILLTLSFMNFSASLNKTYISLMDVSLIIIPMISLLMGTIYVYHSRDFITLLLSQAIARSKIFWGIFLGFIIPYITAFSFGILIPFILYQSLSMTVFMVIIMGTVLTIIFSALAFLLAFKITDRARGIGISVVLWLFFAILYDGMVLYLSYILSDYPIEKMMIVLMVLNPIDLFRTFFLMIFDISALMGYTGAVFKQFFGTFYGPLTIILSSFVWISLLLNRAKSAFLKQDF